MARDRNALRAGVFIVLSVVLIVVVVLSIKGLDAFVQPMQVKQITFTLTDDIGGLRVGDDVRIGGFRVGAVRSIDVVSTGTGIDPDRIVVSFAMPRKYVLREGTHVGIQGTLTGMSWVNFESLGIGRPLDPERPLIGRPSPASQLISEFSAAAPEIRALVADVRTKTLPAAHETLARFQRTADNGAQFMQDLREQVAPLMAKYQAVMDRAGEMMVQVRDLVGDTKTDFRTTVANLNSATGSLKDKLPVMLDQANSAIARIDASVSSIQAALADVQATVANARALSAAAKGVIAGNRGKLDTMIASMKTTSENLKAASSEIRRSPWRLLYKPAANEMGNLNLFDSARQFADGATTLNDATLALRDALNNPDVDKAELQKLMERVQQSFEQFHDVEQKLWRNVKE